MPLNGRIVVAENQKASGVCCNRNQVDHSASASHSRELAGHRHHCGNVHVGQLQQSHVGEGVGFIVGCHYVLVAAHSDAVLLLKNCLRPKTQGNYKMLCLPFKILRAPITVFLGVQLQFVRATALL